MIGMTRIRNICLMVGLIIVLPGFISAQALVSQRQDDIDGNLSYQESVYIVSNFSNLPNHVETSREKLSLDELLEKEIEGFYFYIKRDTVSDALLLRHQDGSFSGFNEALASIRRSLSGNPRKLITLFLDFYVDANLTAAFEEAGLKDYLLEYDTKNGWPSLKKMVDSDKRLVVFEVRKHLNSPEWLHDMNEFVEHTDPDWGNESNEVESFDERLKKSLSLFTGYKFLSTSESSGNDISAFARQNPFLIEAFKKAWVREGQIPNFILVDKYYSWLYGLLFTFRNFHIIHGTVTYNGELVNYVNWLGMSNSTTGKFSFPLEPDAELLLAPDCPGYKVEPATAYVSCPGKKIVVPEFKAKPLKIQTDIEVYLPLEGNARDCSYNRNPTIPRGVEFVYDPIRGQAASFEGQARIDLPTGSELRMRDHDFSVGVWLKIPKYLPEKSDYCILGSKNSTYQQALHFLIRDQKPYMGFYNNDLVGNTRIEPGKWYHVVWRYNKGNGEQAIFVNGKLDAISYDRPAYLGSDSLFVGYLNFSQTASFVGMMDNLCVWSRVLSDKEILGLNSQLVDLHIPGWLERVNYFLVLAVIVVTCLIGYVCLWFTRRKKARETAVTEATPFMYETNVIREPEKRNYIRLFGEFYVLDRNGEDITSLFTPKLKQLFILIMLHSSQGGGSGISSGDLTEKMWGNAPVKSTKSLRSVSILKLRKILERIDKVEIQFNSNRYLLQLSNGVYCDYLVCLDMLKGKRIKTDVDFERFYEIIGNGEIFKGESFGWMDDFKSYICNSSVDVLSRYLATYSQAGDSEKVVQITDRILLNDPSNEDALSYKVRALIAQDNFRSARYAYDKFCTLYREMYGEDFSVPFEQIASKSGV